MNLKDHLRDLADIFRSAFYEWLKDRAPMLAAATAYYIILSLTPLLVLTIVLMGYILGRGTVQVQILHYVQSFEGPSVGRAIETMIEQASNPASSYSATILGLVFLFTGAAGAFVQARTALNIIWHKEEASGQAVKRTVIYYILSFLLMLALGVLLFISVMITAFILPVIQSLPVALPLNLSLIQIADLTGSLLIVYLLLAVSYKFMVNVGLEWGDVYIGSLVTALLFIAGNQLLEIYMRFSNVDNIYGAASTLFIFVIWLYYSVQIFFYGAEFIKVYSRRRRNDGL